MKTITLEDGTQQEVLTAEEIDAQKEEAKQEAIEAYKAEYPDKTDELTKLQEELDKLKGKDLNFDNLRKAKETAEKKVEDILKGVDEKISTVKKEVMDLLATKEETDALNSSVLSSGGVGRLNIKGSEKKFTPEEIETGAKFGLKPEDFPK